ncbi:hypothetical protein, partial [Microcystis sp. M034S2]|uniref:hypothetical protein n=1 Tax=Microcystis sp. M034S2 TaxID=2771162 RepID=UPI0025877B56
MVSEFIELRSSAGNNRVNHGIGVFWGFLVGVGRTRCAPTGFGGFGFFGVFWWGLGARGAPLRVLGGLGFLGFFGGGWAHAVRPYGF